MLRLVMDQVGSYDPISAEMVLENVSHIDDVLSHRILRIYKHSPLPVVVLLLTVSGVCIILTTVILILFVYYRKAEEIKATSLNLSLTALLLFAQF